MHYSVSIFVHLGGYYNDTHSCNANAAQLVCMLVDDKILIACVFPATYSHGYLDK